MSTKPFFCLLGCALLGAALAVGQDKPAPATTETKAPATPSASTNASKGSLRPGALSIDPKTWEIKGEGMKAEDLAAWNTPEKKLARQQSYFAITQPVEFMRARQAAAEAAAKEAAKKDAPTIITAPAKP